MDVFQILAHVHTLSKCDAVYDATQTIIYRGWKFAAWQNLFLIHIMNWVTLLSYSYLVQNISLAQAEQLHLNKLPSLYIGW